MRPEKDILGMLTEQRTIVEQIHANYSLYFKAK